jgi:hypothetical protein
MVETPGVLGLVAGGGRFPMLVLEGARRRGLRVVAAAFKGHSNLEVLKHADEAATLKIGQLSRIIDFFKDHGVDTVTMAGTINKAKAVSQGWSLFTDPRARRLLLRMSGRGDDVLLKAVTSEFDAEGMAVVPPHGFVPELLTPRGVLTSREPDEREWRDLRFGWRAAKTVGALDVGQCVVLREGVVAAVEALEGTDRAVARGCKLGGAGCVVVKVLKPSQEERADLPSAGPGTIKAMAKGKAACLGLEAGRSLFFDAGEAVAAADQAGICVVGLDEADLQPSSPEGDEKSSA